MRFLVHVLKCKVASFFEEVGQKVKVNIKIKKKKKKLKIHRSFNNNYIQQIPTQKCNSVQIGLSHEVVDDTTQIFKPLASAS